MFIFPACISTPKPAVSPACEGFVPVRFPATRKDGPNSANCPRLSQRKWYLASTGNSQVTTGEGETLLRDPSGSTSAVVKCSVRKSPSTSRDQLGRNRSSIAVPIPADQRATVEAGRKILR